MMDTATQLDARGLMCPIPVLRTKKAIQQLETGDVLEVLSSDPGSSRDLKAFCQQTGSEFISANELEGDFVIRLRKG